MAILDQVRKNKFKENIASFSPVETLDELLLNLSEKERDIVKKRYGLESDKKHTLEEIGQSYGITRERVRQIENLTVKKLQELRELKSEIKETENLVAQLLEQYGGVMEEGFFLENVLSYINAHPESKNAMLFLAEYIFSENIGKVRQDREFNNLWKLSTADVNLLKEVISNMVCIIESHGKPIKMEDLLAQFKETEYFKANKDKVLSAVSFLEATDDDVNKILESYLRASRKIKQDLFSEWGLVSWGIVQPKKINDKIYVTLKKAGNPLHFTEITKLINENGFDDSKVAYPPTVHNELILDDKYVLIGRGIYALKEWGYKPGNVADVVEEILSENGPLTKEQIIEKVLEKRKVKRSTIYLSLMNSPKIIKVKGDKYTLKDEESPVEDSASQ